MRGPMGTTPGGMYGSGRGRAGRKPGGCAQRDRWSKRAAPPLPPGLHGRAIAGLPALHKTENKFRVRLSTNLCCAPADKSGLIAMQPVYLQFHT